MQLIKEQINSIFPSSFQHPSDRDTVEDSNGLRSIFLEELWNSPPRTMEPSCPIYDAPSDSDMVKSKDLDSTDVTDPKDDDCYCLNFLADCRNQGKVGGRKWYFGGRVLLEGKLEVWGDPLKGFEWIVSGHRRRELGRRSQNVMIIAGSPKLNAYETDFGWGRPNMSEILHADDAGAMWLSDSREQERGGIEVGLALSAFQMKKFNAILEEQLIDMDVVVPHELSILNDRNTRGRYIRLSSNVVQSQLDKPINLIDACHIGIEGSLPYSYPAECFHIICQHSCTAKSLTLESE
ncbi:Anthocyanin 5-aromatic acyltransferase [Glycine soja]